MPTVHSLLGLEAGGVRKFVPIWEGLISSFPFRWARFFFVGTLQNEPIELLTLPWYVPRNAGEGLSQPCS